MKLIDNTTLEEIILPDGLMWQDEMTWAKVQSAMSYSVGGALIIQQGSKLEGRPITLGAEPEMDWVPRSTVLLLLEKGKIIGRTFTLKLEYPDDTREFNVIFAPVDDPIESSPVKGFPEHHPDSWWHLKLKLIEVLSI